MKTFYLITMIAVFLLPGKNGINAQTAEPKLNQIELMKKYLGTWKCEIAKDTFYIEEEKPFGDAIEGNYKYVTKDKIIDTGKQLIGYDKENDKFIIVQFGKSSPVIQILAFWFTSKNESEGCPFRYITNPENAPSVWKNEFKSPDMFVETDIANNKKVGTRTYTRIKM
jgi:hypothetical protein